MHVARFCLALALLGSGTLAQAETISLGALKDNTIYESTLALSNGAGEFVHTGRTKEGVLRRGLIAFDVAAALPANAVVTNVELTMNMSQANDASIQVSSLHRLMADWGEGTSNASGGEGSGAPAAAGDATFANRFHPDTAWSTAGGDFVPLASASTDVSGLGIYVWTSAGMIADVQDWLGDTSNNFGWIIRTGDEIEPSAGKRFDSRTNPEFAFRPSLSIDYVVVPEPSTWILAVAAAAMLPVVRRHR
ncbi:MAG: DNRLRE domain-containing protein [Planctomycetia bacterium]|nr:DNRLRE domain-containing protein [Planctomycetia bacterium]